MPNNLIFNKVASQLVTLINGQTAGGVATPILTAADGSITVTASNLDIRDLNSATDSVTVTVSNLDIRDLNFATDSVTVTASNLDIRDLNFATDSVTVTADNLDIRDLNFATDSVTVGSYIFTTDNASYSNLDDDAAVMAKDTSQQYIYSYYVNNTGTNPLTVKLQISPTATDGDYMDDPSGSVIIAAGGKTVLVADNYLQYTRLFYLTPSGACTFSVYYNARV